MSDAVKEITGVDFDQIQTDEEARTAAIGQGMDKDEVQEMTRGKILAEMFEEYCEDVPGYLDGPVFVVGHPVEISPLAKRDPEDPRITRRFEAYINGWEIANAFSELNDPIDHIILFPTMKPLDSDSKKAKKPAAAAPEKIDFSNVEIEPLFEDMVDFDTFSKSDFRAVKIKECEAVPKSKKLLKFVLDDGTAEDRVILSGIHDYYEPEDLVGKTAIAIVNLPPRKMMGIDSCGMLISAVHHEKGEERLHLLMVDDHIPAGAKLY